MQMAKYQANNFLDALYKRMIIQQIYFLLQFGMFLTGLILLWENLEVDASGVFLKWLL